MHIQLREFIDRHCDQHPAALLQVSEFLRHFRDSLPAKSRGSWSRGRVLTDLAQAGFVIGTQHKIAMIGGLALRGEWREIDGRLMLAR
jgi:hypothetical protein